MWVIEKIEKDIENHSRYIVCLFEGVLEAKRLSLDESTLGQFFIRKGMEMDAFLLEEILFFDATTTAYKQSLSFIHKKRRTTYEVALFLKEQNFTAPIIQEACKKLQSYGLLQDEEYTKAFVRTKKNVERLGRKEIERLCIEKGLSEQEILIGLKQYSDEEELTYAQYWMQKAYKKFEKYSTRERVRRTKEFLQKKGFGSEVIAVAFSFIEEKDENSEWDTLVKQGEKLLRKYANLSSNYEKSMKIKQALYRKGFQLENIDRFIKAFVINDTGESYFE